MIDRRSFLGTMGALALASPDAFAQAQPRRKMAIVTTEWRYRSHAWHMGERFLAGYPINGTWHHPPFEVVSVYVDQFPDNDLSRARSKEFGFTIYPTIAEAICGGGKDLAVDAVLIIGEHGNYQKNEFGQRLYPRYQFFKQVTDVFQDSSRSVPVFNDKHLSWKWSWAKEMVNISRDLNFAFLAGSSLPVTWRMPSIDLPLGSELDEVMCVSPGGVDSSDFHALETIQCMAERRAGGETGVQWVHSMRGDQAWEAMARGSWDKGGWSSELFNECLCRSQTLAQPESYSHRFPTTAQVKQWVKEPVVYRFQYNDGVKGTMILVNGLVSDFTFAAKIQGESKPLSTLFYLPPNPNVVYSAALMSKVEEMFLRKQTPYPVERTLLTTGLLEACVQSLTYGKRLPTPHLDIGYQPSEKSTFWQT